MPRAFAADERARIEQTLLAAAAKTFIQVGLKRADVASLARAAGIAKGTFYLFFPSKEALFMAVAVDAEQRLRAALIHEVENGKGNAGKRLERLLRLLLEQMSTHPVLRVLSDPAEAAALFRTLSPEQVKALQSDDERFFDKLFKPFAIDGATATAFGRAVFVLTLEQTLLGPDERKRAVDLLIAGMLARRRT